MNEYPKFLTLDETIEQLKETHENGEKPSASVILSSIQYLIDLKKSKLTCVDYIKSEQGLSNKLESLKEKLTDLSNSLKITEPNI